MSKSGKGRGTRGGNKASLAKSEKSAHKGTCDTTEWQQFLDGLGKEGFAESILGNALPGTKDPQEMARVILAVMVNVGDLLRANMPNIEKIRLKAEDDSVSLGFGVKVDYKDTSPKVAISVSYSETFKDKRETVLRDPNEIPLPFPEGNDGTSEDPNREGD
jgi:hypothetical protein